MRLQFDGPGGDLRIIGFLIALFYQSLNGNRLLPANALQQRTVPQNHLHHGIHIAHIHKRNAAVVADILYPARDAQFLSDILLTHLI